MRHSFNEYISEHHSLKKLKKATESRKKGAMHPSNSSNSK